MKKIGLRIIAFTIASAMGLSLIPSNASYAADKAGVSEDSFYMESPSFAATASDAVQEEEEEPRYSITDTTTAPAYIAYKNMSDWNDRKIYSAPKNSYAISVATGGTTGEGVLYFRLKYKDKNNAMHAQFIFPNLDAKTRSQAFLNYYANNDNGIYNSYGKVAGAEMNYDVQSTDTATLSPYTVQDFIFQAEAEMTTVEGIDVYLESGSWTVQGMSVYKVNSYKGYQDYAMMSGQQFLDFEGELVANITKKKSNDVTYKTGGSDKVFFMGGDKAGALCQISNLYPNFTAKPYAGDDSVYSLRMDFADQADAGLESLINPTAATIADYKPSEDIAIEFQYTDTNGWTRKVTIPYLTSCYYQALKAESNSSILGFAQRGDTIAFQGLFPYYSNVIGEPVIHLGNSAVKVLSDSGITASNLTNTQRASQTKMQSDDIALAGVSLYKGGCMPYIGTGLDSEGNTVNAATLSYLFQNSEPLIYYTTTDPNGWGLRAGGKDKITFKTYKSKSPIVAIDTVSDSTYLVTLETSKAPGAATDGNITARFFFENYDGERDKTYQYSVKSAASELYAPWPTVTGGDYIETAGFQEGGKLSFFIEANDVRKFTGAEISLLGSGWQMKNLTISYVENYDARKIYLKDTTTGKATTKYWVERSMRSSEIFSLQGSDYVVYNGDGKSLNRDGKDPNADREPLYEDDGVTPVIDEKGNIVYKDDPIEEKQKTSGEQYLGGGDTYTFDFNTTEVTDRLTRNYSDVYYSMTYEQTGINWGFFKVRRNYNVQVKVAPDTAYDTGNGNSGSQNHFFFQLLFEHGNSAYVLANQQLTGDGFRSDATETFSVSVNQDYGELLGVRIIPEDNTQDSDEFDKLNIQNIKIAEQNFGASFMRYVIDDVGWIDIDYRDELEGSSSRGLRPRTADELSKIYPVSGKEKCINLLCEITNTGWDSAYQQFEGSVWATLHYTRDSDGEPDEMTFDVIQAMAAYNGQSPISVEVATNPEAQVVGPDGLGTVSDPKWMFRASKTDRFIISGVSDIKKVDYIEFTANHRGTQTGAWNIKKVCLSTIKEEGSLELSKDGEFKRNLITSPLCFSTFDKVNENVCQIGVNTPVGPIYFTQHVIPWKGKTAATPVTRIPNSQNDKINLYIYPTAGCEKYVDSTRVNINKLYYSTPFSNVQQISTKGINSAFSGTTDAMFYQTGLSAPNFIAPGEIRIQCNNEDMRFNHAILQHVRDDVVIDTHEYVLLDGAAKSSLLSAYPSTTNNTWLKYNEQKIAFVFGEGTPSQDLFAEKRDIAVSFTYTSSLDKSSKEYRSPYVYITDQGYTSIGEGTYVELDYDIPYVNEITGYTVKTYGQLQGNVYAGCGVNYDAKKELDMASATYKTVGLTRKSYVSFADSFSLQDGTGTTRKNVTSREPYGEGSVAPVFLTFETTDSTGETDGDDMNHVQMTFNFRNSDNLMDSKLYPDITKYLEGDTKKFVKGSQTVRVMLKNLHSNMDIPSLNVVPYYGTLITDKGTSDIVSEQGGTGEVLQQIVDSRNASWSISGVKVNIGYDKKSWNRSVEQTFLGINQGGILRLNNVNMTTYYTKNNTGITQVEDHLAQVPAKSGDIFSFSVTLTQTQAGFTVKAYKMIGDAPSDVTSDTVTVDLAGNPKFSFTTPLNPTEAGQAGSLAVYKIVISPVDAPEIQDVVMITVEPDPASPSDATSG